MAPSTPKNSSSASAPEPGAGYRWRICALLFLATTINYMDRQVLGLLAPFLQKEIGWTEAEYGFIVTAFQSAYAIGMLLSGYALDRWGTRAGYPAAVAAWSLAAMGHALARTPLGFGVARFALGLGEAGNFPAAVKVVAEWFPKHRRAFATGVFNAGSNVGAIVAPLLVPWIALTWGWREAFLLTGGVGFLWVALWRWQYRAAPRTGGEAPSARPPWRSLFRHRRTWALVIARFMTDPAWWFYLYWAPKFLHDRYGLELDRIGPPLIAVYLAADVGSVAGGWLSSHWAARGWPLHRARLSAMLCCALAIVPVAFTPQARETWMAVVLLSFAAAGHQGWAANIFTLVSDAYPNEAVSSVVGICGFAASVGGMIAASSIGLVLHWLGSYTLVFATAGTVYLAALGVLTWGCVDRGAELR